MAETTSIQFGRYNTNCRSMTSNFRNIHYNYYQPAYPQVMRWLSPLEPKTRHQDVRANRLNGVGDWLLETNTISLVIDTLCDQASEENIAVTCLYCDFPAQKQQTIPNMIGAILKQLVRTGEVPVYLREAFQEGKKEFDERGPPLANLIRMLRIAIDSLPQVFICVDALDECLPENLSGLLESLRDIVRESPKTRIFLTGRPEVKEAIQRCFTKAVVIPISPNTEDIRNYLEMRLGRDMQPQAMSDGLRADIVKIMQENMSDIFLLISLSMDAILGEVTACQRRKKLEEVARGNGLSDAYTADLRRLKGQKGDKSVLGLKALMWVLHSERSLRAEELCHALGVEMGSADLDSENIPALQTVLSSCLGLLTVEASSSIVRLVHFTLQGHLLGDSTLFHNPHSTIAEVCLTYLNFQSVSDLSPTLSSAPLATPLLEYASCYWGKHARIGMTGNVHSLALRLLNRFDHHLSAHLLLLHHYQDSDLRKRRCARRGRLGFTGLHGVSFLGIVEIAAAVLEMKEWNVNATDWMGSTPLIWAARRGHEEVVKMLLERGDINPDQADDHYGRTPLLWATCNGSERAVKMLLGLKDVDPNAGASLLGRTPLSLAAEKGCEGVVKILLERRDVNPNTRDFLFGRTPLLWAAESGREGVVRMLLERGDVYPDEAETENGRTPLSLAAQRGHEGIVNMLLERADVNPNQADAFYGRTPLSWAAQNEHEGVVKMLLEREDVNPNQADTFGRTPLERAAENGHEGIVKMLLERADVNPDEPDTEYGQTLLSWAAGNGYEGIVSMLLEREDVNPDQVDTIDGRAPLSWAAKNGHEEVVKILLEREDVNPHRTDTRYGRALLWWAAMGGHEGVVRLLSERNDVRTATPDEMNRTPPPFAPSEVDNGGVGTTQERDNVDSGEANGGGQAPLLRPSRHRDESVEVMQGRDQGPKRRKVGPPLEREFRGNRSELNQYYINMNNFKSNTSQDS